MRIGIDARFLTHTQKGGFKTYSENLINALAEVDAENEYILYLDRPPCATTMLPHSPQVAHRVVPGGLPTMGAFWREQVGLAYQAARDHLDLFHAPNLTAPLFLPCPLVLTMHDMIWFFPEQFSQSSHRPLKRRLMAWYYRVVPRLAAQRAALLITVSAAARSSIVENLHIPQEQIVVTHEAASPLYRLLHDEKQLDALHRKYQINRQFILALGSADPRKNIATLLDAFALLPPDLRQRHQLVIAWAHNALMAELTTQVQQLGLTNAVRFLANVSNDDLVALYNAAALFAFPSLCEGFGLPLVEAMACGAPVVAADNSSIPEVVGDAALLFPAEDPAQMALCMEHVLTKPALAATLTAKGLERAASFSWQSCAQQTVAAYWCARQRYETHSAEAKPIDMEPPVARVATPLRHDRRRDVTSEKIPAE